VDIYDGRPNSAAGYPQGFLSTDDHFERIADLPRRETIQPDEVGIVGFTMSHYTSRNMPRVQFNYQFFVYLGDLA
jgi:hypothetical protein